MRGIARRALAAPLLAVALFACNAVLGNDEPILGGDASSDPVDGASADVSPDPNDASASREASATLDAEPTPDSASDAAPASLADASPDSAPDSAATPDAGRCSGTPGFHLCGGQCVSDGDPATCGSSCSPCRNAPHATAGCDGTSCTLVCNVDYGNCDHNAMNGCETKLANDEANCGACGHVCSSTCMNGTCSSTPDAGPRDTGPVADGGAAGG